MSYWPLFTIIGGIAGLGLAMFAYLVFVATPAQTARCATINAVPITVHYKTFCADRQTGQLFIMPTKD